MPEKQWTQLQCLLLSGGFAGFCGWLSYLLKVAEGKEFKWTELILYGAISSAAGLIVFQTLSEFDLSENTAAALSGMAGWGGTRVFKLAWTLIEAILYRRAGKTPPPANTPDQGEPK